MGRNYGIASVLLLIFLFLPGLAPAQRIESFFKKGDKAYRLDDLETAREYYASGLSLRPDHSLGNIRMGNLYLQLKQPAIALAFFRKARQKGSEQAEELQLLLAEAYQLNYQFDSAALHYQTALQFTRRKDYDQQDLIRKRLKECQAGLELQGKPIGATVRNTGAPINSPYADYVPVLTDGGNTLIFTSRRTSSSALNNKGKQKEAMENVYFSHFQDGAWGQPQKFPVPSSSKSHHSVIAVSADGKELYLYKDYKGGGIYVSRKTPVGNWAAPVSIGEPINSSSYEPSISLSDDGDYAFFSSDREGGFGGLDIYVTFRQRDGSWSEALNLGPSVNTPYDEDAPFIDSKNNVLYFSSRGHNSMGGYDIFRSTISGSLWSQAKNMGLPVNSPYDDIYFVPTPDEKSGYFASDRPGGLGEKDIYLASFGPVRPAADSTEVAPPPLFVQADPVKPANKKPHITLPAQEKPDRWWLKGIVADGMTGQVLSASVTLLDPITQELVAQVEPEYLGAPFAVALQGNSAFRMQVEKPGYFYYTEEVDWSQVRKEQEGEVQKTILLKPLSVGTSIILQQVLFKFNQMEFGKESRTDLDLLYRLLVDNIHLAIEISGHTDNRGTQEVNQRVSEQRALAVWQHLVERGIDPNRMKAIGYGFYRPIASNATEEGRQRNRRTEFSVLSFQPNQTAEARRSGTLRR
jgi:outer membrane protein OmpA-like peptidoglycan-associated protein/tetratricopeptide (TPR) repeat protein